MNNISTIRINGVEYELVDKATREAINRIDERYIADVSRADIDSQNITSTVTTDSFSKQDYNYFYFTSTMRIESYILTMVTPYLRRWYV